MAKFLSSRNIMLIVATILVIALLVATILVSIPEKTEYKGILKKEDVEKNQTVIYGLETENAFKADVSKFLENMVASFFDTMNGYEDTEVPIRNSYVISAPLLSIFSKSAVPSDKLLSFGSYLRNMDTKYAVESLWFFFVKFEDNGDGTYNARFADTLELAENLTKVDFAGGINDVISATALTADEVGKILYELIHFLGDNDQKEMLESVGRQSFVNIFVASTTIYEAYLEFSLVGGTLSDARLLGELAYEMGAELDTLIEEVGVSTLLTALYLNADTAVDNTKLMEFLASSGIDTSTMADVEKVNTALRSGINLSEFVVYFLRTALMEVGNAPFEYLALHYAGEEYEEEYLYLHRITLARAIRKGVDSAYRSGVIVKNDEELLEAMATFKLTSEEVAVEIENIETRKQEIKNYLGEYLAVINSLAKDFDSVDSVEDVSALSESDKQMLKAHSDFISNFNYNELTTGTDTLASTLFINVVFNVFSDLAEDAIGNAK